MALTAEEQTYIEQLYTDLIKSAKRLKTDEDIAFVRKAFELANEAHSKMRRKSGEPYIIHPIAVAKIVASEIGLGRKAIASALLHDVVEDTDYTVADIERMFGPKIASIVEGLTKISTILDQDASKQIENFRKMLMTMSEDIRVIMIKLADRLHNMRTLDSMPEYKQVKIASETSNVYAPLAERLGLYSIKTELEDLSLKFTNPTAYNEISKKINETQIDRDKYIDDFIVPLRKIMDDNGIKCTIKGRMKSVYSIWRKMQKQNIPFEDVYDLFAIRIIFDHPDDMTDDKARETCYRIMSLITNVYEYHPGRIRDWVKKPKPNGYEALHVTVMGPLGRWVEIQIRSRKMDDIAEKGIASHWKYKTGEKGNNPGLNSLIENMKETLSNTESSFDFLDDFKLDIFTKEIHIFTPKGEIVDIPKGSTVIDFAYDIHTDVGNHAIAAKVNHKMAPLSQTLYSGDQVEILTSRKQTPKIEWLNFAMSARAKSLIKKALKADKSSDIDKGRRIFEKKQKELNLVLESKDIRHLREKLDINSDDEFFYQLGSGQIKENDITEIMTMLDDHNNTKQDGFFTKFWKLGMGKSSTSAKDGKISHKDTFVINDAEKRFSLATCCNPIPGDEVVGYITPTNMVIVHKKDCPELKGLAATHGEKIVTIEWESYKGQSYEVQINIEGIDHLGLVYNITKLISQEANVNSNMLHFETNGEIFTGKINLFVQNKYNLDNLIRRMLEIDGVIKVSRRE
ncbi:MAG: bifunctional (p)ppGpp synthetase/guanosine-3',5'-bis(diphosphate) 3'-pyrophosphohydrolase [Bacteroidales bacterium]|jgi:GTP pyrophosphokinase|nr:bifunctional (p)ppGpp synthetase/guanosine-3',5'-bis(diphosphate) 3'-pyrophosphohydrolase [Bacteroidales bacterium]